MTGVQLRVQARLSPPRPRRAPQPTGQVPVVTIPPPPLPAARPGPARWQAALVSAGYSTVAATLAAALGSMSEPGDPWPVTVFLCTVVALLLVSAGAVVAAATALVRR